MDGYHPLELGQEDLFQAIYAPVANSCTEASSTRPLQTDGSAEGSAIAPHDA